MKSKLKVIIPIAIAVTAIISAVIFIQFKPNEAQLSDNPFELAQNYLVEQSYEQAIAEFEKAIALDPMNVEAYLGIAEAYEAIGNKDMAVQWLEKGFEATGDERLKEKLEDLLSRASDLDSSDIATKDKYAVLKENLVEKKSDEETVSIWLPYKIEGEAYGDIINVNYGNFELSWNNDFELLSIFCNRFGHNCWGYSIYPDRVGLNTVNSQFSDNVIIEPNFTIYHQNGNPMAYQKDYYNEENFLILREQYYNGNLIGTILYEYDNSNRVICTDDGNHKMEFEYDSEGNLIRGNAATFEYNDRGNLIKTVYGGVHHQEIKTYDNGYWTSMKVYEDGVLNKEYNYEYHSNGVLAREYYKYKDNQYPGKWCYCEKKYTPTGCLTEKKDNYFMKSTVTVNGITSIEYYQGYHTSKYDEYGNLIKFIDESPFSDTYEDIYEYTYDGNGNISSCIRHSGEGYNDIVYTYEYNADNQLVKKISDGYVYYEYEYEYDSNGNRIKARRYADGELDYNSEITEFIRLEIPKSVLEEAKRNSHLFPAK